MELGFDKEGASDEKKRAPANWTEFCQARFRNRLEQPRFDKLGMRQVVEACGLRSPKILRVFNTAAELDFDGLPNAFVLKPINLASKRGVMVMHRAVKGRGFWELFRKRRLTLEAIKAEQAEWESLWYQRTEVPFLLVAEEWIAGENGQGRIPFDYKLYTFAGEVKFIIQLDRNVRPPAVAFFLNEFELFDYTGHVTSTWKHVSRGEPRIPACWREIVSAAKAISMHLRTAFISVDTYATAEGPVIGELTPVPGGPYYGRLFRFTPEFDAELGRYWEAANNKLGVMTPQLPERFFATKRKSRLPSRLPSARRRKRKKASGKQRSAERASSPVS